MVNRRFKARTFATYLSGIDTLIYVCPLSPDEQKLKAELVQAIQDGRIVILGLIRQELLSGIKEKAQFDKVKTALDSYLDEPIHSADHEYAARIYNECRNQGVEAGTVDILVCALAVCRGWEVLSGDGGLNRCLAVAKKLAVKRSDVRLSQCAAAVSLSQVSPG